jgi:hypothetical protein
MNVMINLPSSPLNLHRMHPELIWLEPEQIERAAAIAAAANVQLANSSSEAQRWQQHLNALGLVGFEQWLEERLPGQPIQRLSKPTETITYLEVNGFTIGLIAVEQVLDEVMRMPQIAIEQADLAAHFYLLQEISEEQALVTLRGFCRYDELNRALLQRLLQGDRYSIPLDFLDQEPNHLLLYCRSLQPSAIPLPARSSPLAEPVRAGTPTSTSTRLGQWLQNTFDQSWLAIDILLNPEANFALSTRHTATGIQRGKLINLGLQLGAQTVALLVTVTTETEGKLGVLVQLHPTGTNPYLMPGVSLSLRSPTGKLLQQVSARSQDNYIQLKRFKGNPGTRFSIAIQLGHETLEEPFEI